MVVTALILLVLAVTACVHFYLSARQENVYIDKGRRSRPFVNKKYGIVAKPDRIKRKKNRTYKLVEFKSRSSRVYESDVAQAFAGAIAASNTYKITEVEIELGNGKIKKYEFTNPALEYKRLLPTIALALQIKKGKKIDRLAPEYKCRSCMYQEHCRPNMKKGKR